MKYFGCNLAVLGFISTEINVIIKSTSGDYSNYELKRLKKSTYLCQDLLYSHIAFTCIKIRYINHVHRTVLHTAHTTRDNVSILCT